MGFWSSCIFLLHLIATVKLLHQDEGRMLLCACSTSDCRQNNSTTCYSIKCYTEYLEKKDGSDPIIRGCVESRTPILCENRRPSLEPKRKRWPYLKCCDNVDLCNNQTIVAPQPFYNRSKSNRRNHSTESKAAIVGSPRAPPPISAESAFLTEDDGEIRFTPTRKVKVAGPDSDKSTAKKPSGIEDFLHPGLLQAFRAFSPGSHRHNWPICKPVVLAVLVVGMFLLISILGFGFYILRSQSNYLQRFMQGYMKSPDEEDTLNPVRATANTQIQIPLIVNKIDKRPISNL